jgi:hypothetical protein
MHVVDMWSLSAKKKKERRKQSQQPQDLQSSFACNSRPGYCETQKIETQPTLRKRGGVSSLAHRHTRTEPLAWESHTLTLNEPPDHKPFLTRAFSLCRDEKTLHISISSRSLSEI